MKRISAILFVVFLVSCVSRVRHLTIREACDIASAVTEQRVKVSGFYFHHFEGDSLQSLRGGQGWEILLAMKPNSRARAGVPMDNGKEYHDKYVTVSGILRRGPMDILSNCPYIEVDAVKVNNEPKPMR